MEERHQHRAQCEQCASHTFVSELERVIVRGSVCLLWKLWDSLPTENCMLYLLTQRFNNGFYPLHNCCSWVHTTADKQSRLQVLRSIIDFIPDGERLDYFQLRSSMDMTALHVAARCNDHEAMEILISALSPDTRWLFESVKDGSGKTASDYLTIIKHPFSFAFECCIQDNKAPGRGMTSFDGDRVGMSEVALRINDTGMPAQNLRKSKLRQSNQEMSLSQALGLEESEEAGEKLTGVMASAVCASGQHQPIRCIEEAGMNQSHGAPGDDADLVDMIEHDSSLMEHHTNVFDEDGHNFFHRFVKSSRHDLIIRVLNAVSTEEKWFLLTSRTRSGQTSYHLASNGVQTFELLLSHTPFNRFSILGSLDQSGNTAASLASSDVYALIKHIEEYYWLKSPPTSLVFYNKFKGKENERTGAEKEAQSLIDVSQLKAYHLMSSTISLPMNCESVFHQPIPSRR